MANIVDVNIFKPFHNHTKRVVMSKKGNAINYRLACECGKRSLNVVRKAVMITALASTKKWSRHIVVMMLADTAVGLQRQRCATMTRHIRFTYVCMLVNTYMRVRRLKSNYQAERMAVRVWVSNYNFFYNEVNAESRRIKIKNSFLHTFKWRLPITSGRHNGNTNKQTTSQLLGKTKKSKIIKSVASKIKEKEFIKKVSRSNMAKKLSASAIPTATTTIISTTIPAKYKQIWKEPNKADSQQKV